MIIKSSNIQLNSSHQFLKSTEESESLRFWKTQQQPVNRNALPSKESPTDAVSLSATAQTLKPEKQSLDLSEGLDANHGAMFLIIKEMIRRLTGKEFKLFSPDQLTTDSADTATDAKNVEITTTPPSARQPASAGFGLVYEHRAVYQESESSSFSANGVIKTQDGKSIDFSVTLNMSRDFRLETNTTITAGDPEKKVDPLVINFAGNAAELSETRFEFDIDANGTTEQIAMLKPGSGFLALDKNKDGVINDGSELFGPNSGNGFSDLAQYDSDKNGFIDEADPIYDSLRIWQRHEDGSQQLIALGDKNIGAIYLGHATTPFQLRTADNQSLGEVTDTGIYLTEDGKTGTVQQIDLSV
ncbi:hypothetical protein [Candidatus Methylobacter oryzae]|uniref:VCBS repeat-containing protein n=1 Tax=Candidatus Methylobacter oryzae TaxID=2497749 RepID=A0ABY3C9Y7_9GAMM|nr:hypothetical protein [Candidatus Methylobacter oryzae]TRW94625.1 hypothetical protein EKO24_011215 [Candidatus Methylobacter oryzae]